VFFCTTLEGWSGESPSLRTEQEAKGERKNDFGAEAREEVGHQKELHVSQRNLRSNQAEMGSCAEKTEQQSHETTKGEGGVSTWGQQWPGSRQEKNPRTPRSCREEKKVTPKEEEGSHKGREGELVGAKCVWLQANSGSKKGEKKKVAERQPEGRKKEKKDMLFQVNGGNKRENHLLVFVRKEHGKIIENIIVVCQKN